MPGRSHSSPPGGRGYTIVVRAFLGRRANIWYHQHGAGPGERRGEGEAGATSAVREYPRVSRLTERGGILHGSTRCCARPTVPSGNRTPATLQGYAGGSPRCCRKSVGAFQPRRSALRWRRAPSTGGCGTWDFRRRTTHDRRAVTIGRAPRRGIARLSFRRRPEPDCTDKTRPGACPFCDRASVSNFAFDAFHTQFLIECEMCEIRGPSCFLNAALSVS